MENLGIFVGSFIASLLLVYIVSALLRARFFGHYEDKMEARKWSIVGAVLIVAVLTSNVSETISIAAILAGITLHFAKKLRVGSHIAEQTGTANTTTETTLAAAQTHTDVVPVETQGGVTDTAKLNKFIRNFWLVVGIFVFASMIVATAMSTDTPANSNESTTSNVQSCIPYDENRYTSTEITRMSEITKRVMSNTHQNTEISEYKQIRDKYGIICPSDLQAQQKVLTQAYICTTAFYLDAITSLDFQEEFTSPTRKECEELNPDLATENDVYLAYIISGSPISTPDGDIVFTKEVMRKIIQDSNNTQERLKELYK